MKSASQSSTAQRADSFLSLSRRVAEVFWGPAYLPFGPMDFCMSEAHIRACFVTTPRPAHSSVRLCLTSEFERTEAWLSVQTEICMLGFSILEIRRISSTPTIHRLEV